MKHIIEGLLFLSGDEGLNNKQLCENLRISEDALKQNIDALMNVYLDDDHGIELVNFGGRYKFVSKEVVYPYAQQLFSTSKMASLSSAALETLAIVAYKQPITRIEIEDIRGVGCDAMIRKLMSRSLLQESGRSDAIGRPILYSVTPEFMDCFQLESLKELPVIEIQKQEDSPQLFET